MQNENALLHSRLTFVDYAGINKFGAKLGLFNCHCGNSKILIMANVRQGRTLSCGCYRKEVVSANKPGKKHGLAKTPIYDIWCLMRRRCYEVGNKNYHQYGGRGITVCEEWQEVETFVKWALEKGYTPGLQIDRKNNNGNYEPSNCHFVTSKVNNNNRRDNRILTFKGMSMTLQQWANSTGIGRETISKRLDKLGWPIEKALTP